MDSPTPSQPPSALPAPAAGNSLWTGGFAALLVVRALTLINDHAIKWLAIGLGKKLVDEGRVSLVLTIGLVGLSLPYVLFSWLAGSLADRESKTSVIRWCKGAEVFIAAAATAVLGFGMGGTEAWWGLPTGLWLLLGAVMAIGMQAALMTPSIVGVIPELVPPSRLSSANGLFSLVSLVAVLGGTAAGNWVADATALDAASAWMRAWPTGMLLGGTALLGLAAAVFLPRLAPAAPDAPPAWNALARTWTDLSLLVRQPELAAAAAGIVFFWAIGAVAQANVDQFATEAGAMSQAQVVPLLVALVAGIGAGSVVTGKLAARPEGADPRVDLGFVPLGGLAMSVAFVALSCIGGHFVEAGGAAAWIPLVWLVALGFGAGMFDVPLETYLQAKSPPERLGGVLGATNLLLFSGMFLASLAYGGLRAPLVEGGPPMLSARAIFAIFALLSLGATAAAVWSAPRATLRLFVASIVHAGWRYRVRHADRAGPHRRHVGKRPLLLRGAVFPEVSPARWRGLAAAADGPLRPAAPGRHLPPRCPLCSPGARRPWSPRAHASDARRPARDRGLAAAAPPRRRTAPRGARCSAERRGNRERWKEPRLGSAGGHGRGVRRLLPRAPRRSDGVVAGLR